MLSARYSIWRFKDLPRRALADKLLLDKAFSIAKNLTKYDGY